METEHRTVMSLLGESFRKNKSKVALLGTKDESLTYAEMWKRVQALTAHLVQTVGVRPGETVGVCMDRNFDSIVTILSLFYAGAVYVPLDPELPQQRLAYMMKDAQIQFVLAQCIYTLDLENVVAIAKCSEKQSLPGVNSKLIILDGLIDHLTRDFQTEADSESELVSELRGLVLPERDPEDLAYMIYTSGSTGDPKGVMVPHRGLVPLALAVGETWELREPESRVLQFCSHSFDASLCEILPALGNGAALVLGSRQELLPGYKLADFIRRHGVTAILMPPSVLATMINFSSTLPLLRIVCATGEACPLALAHKWSMPGKKFINAYGPTECTVATTLHVFDPATHDSNTVPLGATLPGWQVHLLNDQLEPVQDGEVGEIYISGVGVTRGYLNKPSVTSKYFISHPKDGTMLYRSGDLGVRRGPKRLLEFVARVDNQIKINGFRVELGAVEQALCEHPAIKYAVVKPVEMNQDGSNRMLVAYIVLETHAQDVVESTFSSDLLTHFLLDRLPKYMVPLVYVPIDALPLTRNGGKVDRKSLPHPSTVPNLLSSQTKPGPADVELEADEGLHVMMSKCRAIFERVLNLLGTGVTVVEIDSNFFHLGGSSLWIAKLMHEVQDAFGVELLSWQIYKHPTPQLLTFCIIQMQKLASCSQRVQQVDTEELIKEAHSLDKSLRPVGSPKSRPTVALVTGVTGFLGVFLLDNLLTQKPFQVIYCLVRGTSSAHAWDRLQATRKKYGLQTHSQPDSAVKLVILAGDIAHANLGLSPESYAQLSHEIDVIYHVAADTNYIRPYTEMRLPNVEGTKNILHFAATGPSLKTLHYVSTIGLLGHLSGFTTTTFDENFDIDRCLAFFSQGETGYTQSKWVAEMIVLDFMSRGFPVSIYRTGFIHAHSLTGAANPDDLMCRYIEGCFQMGSYPDLPRKFWAPIPVNFAADAMTYISLNEKPGQKYNLVPDHEGQMDNRAMFQCLMEQRKCKREELPVRQWLEVLSMVSPSNPLYPLIAYLSEKIHENRYTQLEMPVPNVGSENTKRALKSSNIEFPVFDLVR